jgi:hypothetical protein
MIYFEAFFRRAFSPQNCKPRQLDLGGGLADQLHH